MANAVDVGIGVAVVTVVDLIGAAALGGHAFDRRQQEGVERGRRREGERYASLRREAEAAGLSSGQLRADRAHPDYGVVRLGTFFVSPSLGQGAWSVHYVGDDNAHEYHPSTADVLATWPDVVNGVEAHELVRQA
jgi:hypothetical protein